MLAFLKLKIKIATTINTQYTASSLINCLINNFIMLIESLDNTY